MREYICENFPDMDFLFADDFDSAIIGICTKTYCIVYSKSKCIEILSKDMSHEEALDFFDFNVAGAYVGEQTPIFVEDEFILNK